MKALTWQGTRDVRVEHVPDPSIEQPTDVIIEVPARPRAARVARA